MLHELCKTLLDLLLPNGVVIRQLFPSVQDALTSESKSQHQQMQSAQFQVSVAQAQDTSTSHSQLALQDTCAGHSFNPSTREVRQKWVISEFGVSLIYMRSSTPAKVKQRNLDSKEQTCCCFFMAGDEASQPQEHRVKIRGLCL